jgi:hypothetical protein
LIEKTEEISKVNKKQKIEEPLKAGNSKKKSKGKINVIISVL